MTPGDIEAVRTRLDAIRQQWDTIAWAARGRAPALPFGDTVTLEMSPTAWPGLVLGEVVEFCQSAPDDLGRLLAHVQNLQAELEQLRTIFSRDMLEDDASIRAAYERGKMDAARELAEAVRSKPHALLSALLEISEDLERSIASVFGVTYSQPPG